MLGRVKLDNTLLTCDQGNFNEITARGRNRTLVTVVRDMCTFVARPSRKPQINSPVWTSLLVNKYLLDEVSMSTDHSGDRSHSSRVDERRIM